MVDGEDPTGGDEENGGGFLAFWSSLPGVLKGLAAVITAAIALIGVWRSLDGGGDDDTATPATNAGGGTTGCVHHRGASSTRRRCAGGGAAHPAGQGLRQSEGEAGPRRRSERRPHAPGSRDAGLRDPLRAVRRALGRDERRGRQGRLRRGPHCPVRRPCPARRSPAGIEAVPEDGRGRNCAAGDRQPARDRQRATRVRVHPLGLGGGEERRAEPAAELVPARRCAPGSPREQRAGSATSSGSSASHASTCSARTSGWNWTPHAFPSR